jgi:hypothetical protein
VTRPNLPGHDSQEYLWWSQGARDEAEARDEGLDYAARQVRDFVAGYARLHPEGKTEKDLATTVMRVFCPDRLKRKYR